jgi:two-component system chemotaxis sensor kinase CheA
MTKAILTDMKHALMQPVLPYLQLFPALVRSIAREQGKEVSFRIEAAEIEVDRRILEVMKNPLIHLLRNSIDHGVELPATRELAGKPREATVKLSVAELDDARIEIVVSDDGAGIDFAKVRVAAENMGHMPAGNDAALVFLSGVSTSPNVTSISGRGLGLAIVRDKVEILGGSISLESRPSEGCLFRITLPMTLATYRGVVIRACGYTLVMPTSAVERVVRYNKSEIRTTQNRETVEINGRAVTMMRLSAVLGITSPSSRPDANRLPLLIVQHAGMRMAFAVDEIVDEEELLVKQLGKQLSRVRNVAGVAVLASGGIAPILHVSDLLKCAVKSAATNGSPAEIMSAPAKAAGLRILVVEDSVTTRTVLKNILETAGYRVRLAEDGVEALAWLKAEGFDLVISDVDMPRMNGLELTSRIRSEEQLSKLPVILVTGLESKEDRERGMGAGANAYLEKKRFDQDRLLDVIRRLA